MTGCESFDLAAWTDQMDAADRLFAAGRPADAGAIVADAHDRVPCLVVVAPPSAFARFAHQEAVVAFFAQDQDDAVAWALAADAAFPGYPWPSDIGSGHPLRVLVARADEPTLGGPTDRGLAVPKGGAVVLDGAWLAQPRARAGLPGLVQVADRTGAVVEGTWQDGAAFPANLLGDPVTAAAPAWWHAEDRAAALAAAHARYGDVLASASAASCSPWTAAAFEAAVASAGAAIDVDDVATFGTINRDIQVNLPCLVAQVPKDAWADYLVDVAVVEYSLGQAWNEPLDTALTINPALPRAALPPPLQGYSPPPAPPSTGVLLPSDAVFFVDGRQVTTVPELRGLHLVQRRSGADWTTRLLRNEAFPAEWTPVGAAVVDRPAASVPVSARVVALAGFGGSGQVVDGAGSWLADDDRKGLALGIGSWGAVKTPTPLAFAWDVAFPLQLGGGAGTDVFAGGGVAAGPLVAWVGGGVTSVTARAGGSGAMLVAAQPHLAVSAAVPLGSLALELGAGGGGTGQAVHAGGRIGVASVGGLGWTAGLDGSFTRAGLVGVTSGREASASRTWVGLAVGLALGRQPA